MIHPEEKYIHVSVTNAKQDQSFKLDNKTPLTVIRIRALNKSSCMFCSKEQHQRNLEIYFQFLLLIKRPVKTPYKEQKSNNPIMLGQKKELE
jgi:hypothetical protein